MPRGKPLSEIEKGQIMAYHETGMTNRSIATRISRSHDLINNFLKNPENYGKNRRGGPKPKLTPRDKRRILAAASNTTSSCRKIKEDLDLDVSTSSIRRAINSSGVIVQA